MIAKNVIKTVALAVDTYCHDRQEKGIRKWNGRQKIKY
jgi:hypothetical protein